MAAKAKAMQAAGIDVISMSLGEPDFDTPAHIRRAAQDAIDNHFSHYGPVPGLPSLRSAIAQWQNQKLNLIHNTSYIIHNTSYIADDVVVSVGAKMALFNAIQATINPGNEVIIPMPSWVSYSEMVKLAGGTVVPVLTRFEDDYCLTPDQLRAAITPRTRMLILCSPNNPTGSVYSADQLSALVDVLRSFPDIIIISDEVYDQLIYQSPFSPFSPLSTEGAIIPSFASFPDLADRLIRVNAVSKSFAMTGYRIGWLLSKNKDFIAACIRLQGQQLTCATIVAQKAAEAALTGPQDCVAAMRAQFQERRDLICRLAADIPGLRFRVPQGAFYLFPDVSAFGSGDEVAQRLLDEAHVAVIPGSAFGCPECIRLSYAIETPLIVEALRRLSLILSSSPTTSI